MRLVGGGFRLRAEPELQRSLEVHLKIKFIDLFNQRGALKVKDTGSL
jgi:hypothetical protein